MEWEGMGSKKEGEEIKKKNRGIVKRKRSLFEEMYRKEEIKVK